MMRFAVVLVLLAVLPVTVAGEGFLVERAAAMQPQQRDPSPDRAMVGFVTIFAGIGLSVAALDYSREVPVAPGSAETRRVFVTTVQRPALLWAGLGAMASGALMATVWQSTDRQVAVGPGNLTIRW